MRSRSGKVHLKSTPEQLRSAGILLDEPLPGCRLNPAAVFGNRRPVEVEVGPGKGAFLLDRARQRPEINLLGIEWVPAYAHYAADRAHRAGLGNVRVLCADAKHAFEYLLPERSVLRVHVYFPDPWPKRRHGRRRVVTAPFLRRVRQVLLAGGSIAVVTDHKDYFRQMRMAFSAVGAFAAIPFGSDEGGWLVGSNFEKKYAAAGRPFYAIAAIRCR